MGTYQAGDEVCMVKGTKCNSELLDFHGYLLDNNTDDCVHVDVELSADDPLMKEKRLLYAAWNPDPSLLRITVLGPTEEFVHAVKIVTLSSVDYKPEFQMSGVPSISLSDESEFAIASYIVKVCRDGIQSYRTSIQEDMDILATSQDYSPRERLAVRLRLAEKEIYRFIGSWYYQRMQQLMILINQNHGHTEL